MGSNFKFKKLTVHRNSKKYTPERMLWVDLSAHGLMYISLPKGRYYFYLKNKDGSPNKNIKNIKLDDSKKSISLDFFLPKESIGNDFGRAVTSKFKFVFERNADYQKAKTIFLKNLGDYVNVKGTREVSKKVKISFAKGRKSRRGQSKKRSRSRRKSSRRKSYSRRKTRSRKKSRKSDPLKLSKNISKMTKTELEKVIKERGKIIQTNTDAYLIFINNRVASLGFYCRMTDAGQGCIVPKGAVVVHYKNKKPVKKVILKKDSLSIGGLRFTDIPRIVIPRADD